MIDNLFPYLIVIFLYASTPPLVVGIARNAVQAHQQRCLDFNTPSSPLVLNCLTGSERSEIVAIGISVILATQTKRPVLISNLFHTSLLILCLMLDFLSSCLCYRCHRCLVAHL